VNLNGKKNGNFTNEPKKEKSVGDFDKNKKFKLELIVNVFGYI
jgi:hypothetical protein